MIPSDRIPARDLTAFSTAEGAVDRLCALYDGAVGALVARFEDYAGDAGFSGEVRECYPYVLKRVDHPAASLDVRDSYGSCQDTGVYGTTVTNPGLFRPYLTKMIRLLLQNHGGTVEVGISTKGIPIHFAFAGDIAEVTTGMPAERVYAIRRHFDVPDLAFIDDAIVDGVYDFGPDQVRPMSLFSGPRVDYSLHRLRHYTGTDPKHFQTFVLFTNYQFYVEEFVRYGRELMARGGGGYTAFVEPGGMVTTPEGSNGTPPARLPQMPAYHLVREDGEGLTLVNIGVGPSNAKTITDHIAVLRPHCWLMLGHCAGLRNKQRLGDYVLAHAYLRQDHVLDDLLPISIPIPAIAEVQTALQEATQTVTGFDDYGLKQVMRTGTVATVDDRNWEVRNYAALFGEFNHSRAIALDMESATIAANGYRYRVPYGTLLCVSDKPLHGEIKLPGMADAFYRERVNQHLQIGIKAMEILRDRGPARLHSRKLRTFSEPPFR